MLKHVKTPNCLKKHDVTASSWFLKPTAKLIGDQADEAELTLTLMAQGYDQPNAMELGSFTRTSAVDLVSVASP